MLLRQRFYRASSWAPLSPPRTTLFRTGHRLYCLLDLSFWARWFTFGLLRMVTRGMPVVDTVGAVLFLGEPVTLVETVGIAFVIAAIAMVMRPRSRPLDEDVLPV